MLTVEFEGNSIKVDAALVAEGLGIAPSLLRERIHRGEITSLCERGFDDDNGRYRLSFFSSSRRFRLVVDASGNVIKRFMIDFSNRALPRSMRKPEGAR
jgi:hypothetical protein